MTALYRPRYSFSDQLQVYIYIYTHRERRVFRRPKVRGALRRDKKKKKRKSSNPLLIFKCDALAL